MRKHRRSVWSGALSGTALSAVFGSLCGGACAVLFAAVVYVFMDDWKLIGKLAAAALAVSGFSGGFLCGKFRRKRGIAEGAACGALIYVILSVLALIFTGGLPNVRKLVLLAVSGIVGGVSGVNSKRPKDLMY